MWGMLFSCYTFFSESSEAIYDYTYIESKGIFFVAQETAAKLISKTDATYFVNGLTSLGFYPLGASVNPQDTWYQGSYNNHELSIQGKPRYIHLL